MTDDDTPRRVVPRALSVVWLAVLGLIAARFLLAASQIELPGLQYDEALFVNAADHRLNGVFIFKSIDGVPTMLMQYIGALKAWLYTPLFGLVDPSPATIRLPAVAIASAGIAVLFGALRRITTIPIALLAVVLLSVDASLFWLTRNDVGPNAIGFFLKAAMLYAAVRFANDGRSRWAFLLVLAASLGTFNKLNFVWNVNGALLVGVILIVRHRSWARQHIRGLATLGTGTVALYGGFVWWAVSSDLASQRSGSLSTVVGHTWPVWKDGIVSLLSGRSMLQLAVDPGARGIGPYAVAVLLLAIAGLVLALRPSRGNAAIAAIGVLALTIVPQGLVTDQATAPWHFAELYPYVLILVAFAVGTAAQRLGHRAGAAALVATALLVAVFQLSAITKARNAFASGRETPIWNTAIYALADSLRGIGGTVVSADWGSNNQLMALDDEHAGRYYEDAFSTGFETATATDLAGFARRVQSIQGRTLIVLHGPGQQIFPEARDNVRAALKGHLRRVGEFRARTGAVMFELYEYSDAVRAKCVPTATKRIASDC